MRKKLLILGYLFVEFVYGLAILAVVIMLIFIVIALVIL